MRKIGIIIGLTILVFSSMYLIFLLTKHTNVLNPTISIKNNPSQGKDNIQSLLPYTKILARNNVTKTPYIIFNQDLLNITNNQLELTLHTQQKPTLQYEPKGGLNVLKIRSMYSKNKTQNQALLYHIYFKYQNNYFPKYLYLKFKFPDITTSLILPLIKQDQHINKFAKTQITKDTIQVTVPHNYKVIWVTNGFNRFLTTTVEPRVYKDTWIYSYSLKDKTVLPSFAYIFYQNKYSIITIPDNQNKPKLMHIIANNYQDNFKTIKKLQGLKYKVINKYLILSTKRLNHGITIKTDNKDITSKLYFWQNNDLNNPRTYYYLNLAQFPGKSLTLHITQSNNTDTITVKIPRNLVELGILPIKLTTAQFYALLISLSLILSNFLYYAVESLYETNTCDNSRKTKHNKQPKHQAKHK